MKKLVFLFMSLFLMFQGAMASREPMKYGKVDLADLQMSVYPADSSASAVILCNYGYFDSQNLQFVHQIRIKILKEEGKAWGNFTVPGAEKANVKGQTVNLENGKQVITKLEKSGIFIERVSDNNYRIKVALPNVKAGSVIDLEFYYRGLPPYWNFQESIPMRLSELILEESTYFSFKKNLSGYTAVNQVETDHWIAKDVPAFKVEPYINNKENYLTRLNIEISSVHIPGQFYKNYATTWHAVAETLRDHENFGKQISSLNLYLNGLANDIKDKKLSPLENMNIVFETIKKIKWNSSEALLPSTNGIATAFQKNIGNSAEINLNLICLLKKVGLEAYPLVLSTRDNGILPPFSVSYDKLNYVMAYVTIDDQNYFLDASDEYLPLGMIPERAINGKGLVVRKDDEIWVDLNPAKKNKTSVVSQFKLSEDGTLKGQWSKISFDYAALDLRDEIKSFSSKEDYFKSIEKENLGLSIENYEIKNLDSIQQPVQEVFTVVLKNNTTKLGDQIFINAVIFDRYTENPFKALERVYPVDFTTPIETSQVVSVELPQGYSVVQLPQNIKIALQDKSGSFMMTSVVIGNRVQTIFKLSITKPVYYQPEYDDLKTFYTELVKKQTEKIIIKKG